MPRNSHPFRASLNAFVLCVAAIAYVGFLPAAHAQNATWTGASTTDSDWMTVENWLGNTPPVAGDTVTFDANSAANLANVNDFTGLNINGIVVGAVPSSSLVTIGGNSFTVGAGGIDLSVGGAASLNQGLAIVLDPNQTITLGTTQIWKLHSQNTAGSTQSLTISSPIAGAVGADLTYGITTNATAASSSGTIFLNAANTYAGNTTVGGPNITYELGSNSPFGTGTVTQSSFNTAPRYKTNATVTLSNAMNWVSGFMLTSNSAGGLTFDGPITFIGSAGNRTVNQVSVLQTVTFNGNITMSATGETTAKNLILQSSPGTIVVNGLILDGDSASGTLTKTGAGNVFINSTANTFRGLVAIQNGVLEIKSLADIGTTSSLGTGATASELRFGTGVTSATLRYTGTSNVTTNRPINLFGTTGGATIENNGVGTMAFTANFFVANGNKTFTLSGGNAGMNTISGVIIDPNTTTKVSVTKAGAGTWVLSGANTYTGVTTVSLGTLLVNNTSGSGTGGGAVNVVGGATLGGTGSIHGAVTNDGTIAPGASVGTLTTTAGVTMNANSHLAIELSGASADKLVVGGLLNLSAIDNFLDVTGTGTGTSWVIANYGSLTGTFENVTPGYNVHYGTGANSSITLSLPSAGVAGDYNNNTVVDGADYVVWRKNKGLTGSPTVSQGNGNGDNVVDDLDYEFWRTRFGNSIGSGSNLNGAGAVPEPAAIVIATLCLLMGVSFGCRQRTRRHY